MKRLSTALLFLATAVIVSNAQWIKQSVDTTAGFRGLSVVNEKIIWASGTGGTVIRTTDGGSTWKVITVQGAEKLDFRDIEAFDANTAYVLSIGNGEASRIYKTIDGGATWSQQFKNANEKAFFDAIACWDKNNCIAMSDPVAGRYLLINTTDGGTNWKQITNDQMPPAKDGEAAFAASGTCLYIAPGGTLFLVSGGSAARVFRSSDRGRNWTVVETPLVKGTPGSGIFSIAMFDSKNGAIVGGHYEKPDERNDTFARTFDGGAGWSPGARPRGYRSGVTFLDRYTVVAVGTNGSDISYSRTTTWESLGNENLNAVAAKGRNAVWAVGPKGAVYRLNPASLQRGFEGRVREDDYPHLVNVAAVTLGHSFIARDCASSEKACSNSTTISVATSGPEIEAPHEYTYYVSAGKIIGDGANVTWDLTGVKPGKYTITAGISFPYFRGERWGVLGQTRTEIVVIRD